MPLSEPLELFSQLFNKIKQTDVAEPSAMTLATASADGKPSARVVLLKDFDELGFTFYTNLESQKAKDLHDNPYAALNFYWEQIYRQVRIEGRVKRVSDEEADAYFSGRPRASQIGAWASRQSARLPNRETLEAEVSRYTDKFQDQSVPRPRFWSGFRLIPHRFEFWERRENRLHNRISYTRKQDAWKVELLYP